MLASGVSAALAVSILAAGCYRPSVGENCRVACEIGVTACPGGLRCGDDGLCYAGSNQCSAQSLGSDGGIDVPDGAPGPCAFTPGAAVDVSSVKGWSYIPRADRSLAVYETSTEIDEQAIVDTGPPASSQISDATTPRLFPDQDAAYVLDSAGGGSISLYQRAGQGNWNLGGTVTVGDTVLEMSAPTSTTSRRMILVVGPTTWTEVASMGDNLHYEPVASYSPATLGVGAIADPALTPDGLGLVFAGAQSTGRKLIYYASRTSLAVPFGAAVLLYADTGSVRTPYLEADCGHLYWSTYGSPPQLRRVP